MLKALEADIDVLSKRCCPSGSASWSDRGQVIFVCAAGLGHVYPLLPLARAAVAAGDEVLFVTAVNCRRIAAAQTVGRVGLEPTT